MSNLIQEAREIRLRLNAETKNAIKDAGIVAGLIILAQLDSEKAHRAGDILKLISLWWIASGAVHIGTARQCDRKLSELEKKIF